MEDTEMDTGNEQKEKSLDQEPILTRHQIISLECKTLSPTMQVMSDDFYRFRHHFLFLNYISEI